MDKKTLSRALAQAPRADVLALAARIEAEREVVLVKPPEKTLVLLKVKEPVKSQLFYLGEVIATECLLEVDGARGASLLMGDDAEKARAMAVADAAHTAGFAEWAALEAAVLEMEAATRREQAQKDAMHRRTQVHFHAMEDRDATDEV